MPASRSSGSDSGSRWMRAFDGAPDVESTVSATYFDTMDELGFTLEIGRVPPGFAMPEPELVVSVPDTRQEAR